MMLSTSDAERVDQPAVKDYVGHNVSAAYARRRTTGREPKTWMRCCITPALDRVVPDPAEPAPGGPIAR